MKNYFEARDFNLRLVRKEVVNGVTQLHLLTLSGDFVYTPVFESAIIFDSSNDGQLSMVFKVDDKVEV